MLALQETINGSIAILAKPSEQRFGQHERDHLVYLAIQSGMNLPAQQALYIAIILAVIAIIFVCIAASLIAVVSFVLGGGFAP